MHLVLTEIIICKKKKVYKKVCKNWKLRTSLWSEHMITQ